MKYLSTTFFFLLAISLFGQVNSYPDVGLVIGKDDNVLGNTTKPNMIRLYNENGQEAFDFAVNNQGQLIFYRNGQNLPLFQLEDDKAEIAIIGDDNNGSSAGLRIRSGAQTMLLDGNEIDALADELNLNFNTSEAVTIANGGGGVSINRAGSPADNVDIHLKQQGSSSLSGGMTFESGTTTKKWKIYHSGENISFAENTGSGFFRRAYIRESDGEYIQPSDLRLKENVLDVTDEVFDKIMKLNYKKYNYKNNGKGGVQTSGFIAQEVQALFPGIVYEDEEGLLGVAYSKFGVLAIRGLQEINERISRENEDLKGMVKDLAQRLEKLESK